MTRSTKPRTPRTSLLADRHFVLRTPLLAIEEFVALADPDRAVVRARLVELVARPELREALFLASPSLDASIPGWLQAPESASGQATERTLIRYVARMAGRATPFATCSGVSVGQIGEKTELELESRQAHRRHTRLDHEWLVTTSEALAADPRLRACSRYRPSSTLHYGAEQLRYVEVQRRAGVRVHQLARVAASPVILATLDDARVGRTLDELALALVEREGDVSLDDARAFVEGLVDAQLLVSETAPTLTGNPPTASLRAALERAGGAGTELAASLARIDDELAAIDRAGLGQPSARYRDIAATLAREFPGQAPELGRMLQVELLPATHTLELGPAIVDELARAAELLAELRPAMAEDHPLRRFVRAFQARHGEREVALLDALDEDLGLGFGSRVGVPTPLLSGLELGRGGAPTSTSADTPSELVRLLSRALRSGARELVLDEQALARLRAPTPARLPDALAVVAKLIGTPEALARGEFELVISGAGGPSGARMLARHCHASPAMHRLVADHIAAEEALHPGPIYAEIVHLDHARDGNIAARPLLREYEIVVDARSGAPGEHQLALDDLLVSLVGERVVLRSRRLGREVVPRLSAAHEHRMATQPAYRFLAALQDQDGSSELGWSWGATLEACEFTPRVRHGRMILARATWRLRGGELGELVAALAELDAASGPEARTKGRARLDAAMQALRCDHAMPRFVVVSERDLELPVDFDNPIAVESAARLIATRERVVIREMLPAPDQLPVVSPAGHHAHELIVTFTRRPEAASALVRRSTPAWPSPRRCFAPGSEWLFVKLYTGPGLGDELLRELVAPLRAQALQAGVIDRWFFVRYDDPDHHLRVRFHGEPSRLGGELLPALQRAAQPWLASARLHRMALDTYEPEIDRYGGPHAVDAIESLWWHDSEAVLALLDTLVDDDGEDLRWRLTLLGIASLLDDLGLSDDARTALIERARDGLRREFRAQTSTNAAIGARHRRERSGLSRLLGHEASEARLAPGLAALHARSRALESPIATLRALERAGRLRQPIEAFAWSIGHMHANRLLPEQPRAHELVFYDFLQRESAMRRALAAQGANARSRAE